MYNICFILNEESYTRKKIAVANRVKIARSEKGGLTQSELAKKVGVSRQTMNLIEAKSIIPLFMCVLILVCI
ncbi:helix-turn-helix domain-containing protein [Melghiribacillus thermohalophilus]|uniref:helix-turn-helix domain-containing protein n=1 Tax=Melghiribacillus thermohalophilus TaxID=1324956 RepID=UPI00104A49A1